MSLKINFLIISIGVLTMFVKMVPAPAGDSATAVQDMVDTLIDPVELKIHIVNCNTLIDLYELYKTEIENYCIKLGINPTKKPDISATILFIKDNLNRYKVFSSSYNFGANVLTQYLLMKNDDVESDLLNELPTFKKMNEEEMRIRYESVTFCNLDKNIEDAYFLSDFRRFYRFITADSIAFEGYRYTVNGVLEVFGDQGEDDVGDQGEDDVGYQGDDDDSDQEEDDGSSDSDLQEFANFKFTKDSYLNFIKSYSKELNECGLPFPEGEVPQEYINEVEQKFDTEDFNMDYFNNTNKAVCSNEEHVSESDDNNENNHEVEQKAVTSKFKPDDLDKTKTYLIDQYSKLTHVWEFYEFNLDIFLKYKILDREKSEDVEQFLADINDSISNTTRKETNTLLEKFLEYFKESLDDNYYATTSLTIDQLSDDQQFMYYTNTINNMKNILNSYYQESTPYPTVKLFVEKLIEVAKEIKNSDKYKQILAEKIEEYNRNENVCSNEERASESDVENENNHLITINNYNYYTCDSTTCDLPHTVNIDDIINYLVYKYKKSIKAMSQAEVNAQASTA